MNVDKIAAQYRWLEYAAFARQLEQSRCHFLHCLAGVRNVLIIGDGDGRFTCSLLASNQTAHVDFVELSATMITLASGRINATGHGDRIRYYHADALDFQPSNSRYDLIVTHYVLDCFTTEQANVLIDRVVEWTVPGAQWLVTDFAVPGSFWRRLHAIIWLRTMYLFFRIATGLKVTRLPNYAPELLRCSFRLMASKEWRWGLIRSELWQRDSCS